MGLVGRSYIEYDADLRPLLQKFELAKRSASEFTKQIGDGSKQVTAEEVKLAQSLAKTAEAEARRAAATARRADADARAGVAAAKQNLLEQREQTEAARTAAANDRAAIAALRRKDAEDRLAGRKPASPNPTPAEKGGGGLSFNQALGAFGLVTIGPQIVGQLASFGVEAGKSATELQETKNALRAVAGDTATYSTILKEAKTQQLLFGGSLKDNIDGLSGLAVTSRNTGAKLGDLIDIQKRLAVLNPAQGAQGGLIALNEALAGNLSSLSRRFNIPRAELQKLNDTALPVADRLKVIDGFLNGVGITSAAVAGKVDQNAAAFRRLVAELDTAKNNAGSGLAEAFSGAATGLSRLIGLINQNPQAIAELKGLLGGKSTISQADIDAAARQVAESNAEKFTQPLTGSDTPLASQASLANGAPTPEEQQQAVLENEAALQKLKGQLIEVGLANQGAAEQAAGFAEQLRNGTLSAPQFVAEIQALSDQQNRGRDIEAGRITTLNALRDAEDKATAELVDGIEKKNQASAAAQKLADIENTIAQIGAQVRQGLINSSQGADILANALHISAGEAAGLIDQLNKLAGAQVPKGAAAFSTQLPRDLQVSAGIATKLAQDETNRQDRINRTGTALQKLQLAQEKYNKAVRDFGKDSKEAFDAQTTLIERKNDLAKGPAGGKGLSSLDRSELALITDKQARLDEINAKLARGNLTQLQRNQLLKEAADLEKQISDAKEKQQDAALSAAAAEIENRKAGREEGRQLQFLDKIARAGGERGGAAADEASLIRIRAEQRARALNREIADAGGVAPSLGTVPLSAPQPVGAGGTVPPGSSAATAGGAGVNLNIALIVGDDVIASATLKAVQSGARVALRANTVAAGG